MAGWKVCLLGVVVLCTPAQAARYFVNTVEDTPDATPADGLCADSAGPAPITVTG
jgi:hypothetical protein